MIKMSPFRIALAIGSIALASCADQPNYQSQVKERPRPNQDFPAQAQYPSQGYRAESTYVGTVDRIEVFNSGNPNNRITVRMDNGGYQTIAANNIGDLRTGDRVRVDGSIISRY